MRLIIPILVLAAALAAPPVSAQPPDTDSAIDYSGFVELTAEVASFREARLLPKEEFLRRAAVEGALILDTRSAEAFAAGHIKGAVNLPFSDFTDEKLKIVIGKDRSRPIFIYCNNNFSDDAFPVQLKRAPLALNIPTFINLYGYGYTNIWELDGTMRRADVPWIVQAESSLPE
ncbi:rhodanese-like domain-containing protein [Erythrobacter sp. THAF29]|uniref:rhodanese-like domain-containing protein n=1 Tax=Erythrobacter sp. THAF29 TaxID=2587851 RepID=UPI0012695F15|nr:rhodanese-like domain-containing protein [Erythrobacter sp. THAF29]QFT78942.1 Rhodanese-like domain protein [Erythrobacter sp. THAF29]